MTDLSEIENLLQTYTFDEILELNDMTEEDALLFLVEAGHVEFPDPRPIDLD